MSRLLMLLLLVGTLAGLVVPAGADAVYPYPVSVTVTGPGSVTDATGAISCPGTCSTSYQSGETATFTETPQSGQAFAGWSTAAPVVSGCTLLSRTCEVKIDCDACGSSESVAATFDPVLNIEFSGQGTVSGLGNNSSCTSGSCSSAESPGQHMQLTATGASDYQFSSWTGGQCAGQGATCTFTIIQGDTETALFTKKENVELELSPYFSVPASASLGSVTDSTGAINCPGTCSAEFPTGATVVLTYHPGEDGGLPTTMNWNAGCQSTSGNSCTVNPAAPPISVADGANVEAFELPAIPVSASATTITGQMTDGDYEGSKRLIADASLTCHSGSWKGDPDFINYDWSYLPSPPASQNEEDLGEADTGGFPSDFDDELYWVLESRQATATCAVTASSGTYETATARSVTVPVASPQPVRLTSPQIGLHVAPGGTDTCTAGTYKYLYGTGKFAYQWLLSGSAGRASVVGHGATIKVESAWLGKDLGCEVTVTSGTLWKPMDEYSKDYEVRVGLSAAIPPGVNINTDDPAGFTGTLLNHGAIVGASVVDMNCTHGGWIGGSGYRYSYAWVSNLGRGTWHGEHLDFNMHADRMQYDMTVRCAVTATSSDGRSATEYSPPVSVNSGCYEAIEEVASDPTYGQSVSDWAYYELAGRAGLAYTAPPNTIYNGGQVGVQTIDDNPAETDIDGYPDLSGYFGLTSSGVPGTAPWPAFEYAYSYDGAGQGSSGWDQVYNGFTPSHGSATVTGPNCNEYGHYLSTLGYHVSRVSNFGQLIP